MRKTNDSGSGLIKNAVQSVSNRLAERVFIANSQLCSRRYLDAGQIIRYFESNGCKITESPASSDYNILITCAFHGNTERQSFELMEDLKKFPGELIVVGCLPAIAKERFEARFKGKYVGTSELQKLDRYFPHFRRKFADIPDSNFFPVEYLSKKGTDPALLAADVTGIGERSSAQGGTRLLRKTGRRLIESTLSHELVSPLKQGPGLGETAYLRIGNGCQQKCAYCAIRVATGRLVSKPMDELMAEYRDLLQAGYRNFWVIAADTGAYGQDIGSSFGVFLEQASRQDEKIDVRWCVHELNPIWAVRYREGILDRLRRNKIHELIVPIQSASRRILKLMNRYNDMERIEETLKEFRTAKSDLRLVTYLLPGFPTETEDDFRQSVEFARRIRFDRVILFVYSNRTGIPAASLTPQVDEETKARRREYALTSLNGDGMECICMEE